MSEIYLIRHGFTPANNANYNQQRGLWKIAEDKDMPLEMEYGEEQARELGRFLNRMEGNALIMVSPYRRTLQTLSLALQEMQGDYQVRVCDELHENNSGVHYAKTKDEVLEMYPEASEVYAGFLNAPFETAYLGGESEFDVRDRVMKIAEEVLTIQSKEEYDSIFIFAHGNVNRWLYYWINQEMPNFKQKNCEVIIGSGAMRGSSIFLPDAWVPEGYEVDIKRYLKK